MNGWGGVRAPVLWDLGLCALFSALLVSEAVAEDAGAVGLLVAAAMALSLLGRRSHPLSSYLVSTVMLLILVSRYYDAGLYPLANLVGIYSVGAHATRDNRLSVLTDRETQVLRSLATGASNGELASTLFISEETVRTHVKRILGKLGLRDRAQAIVFAYESGLVHPGSPSQ